MSVFEIGIAIPDTAGEFLDATANDEAFFLEVYEEGRTVIRERMSFTRLPAFVGEVIKADPIEYEATTDLAPTGWAFYRGHECLCAEDHPLPRLWPEDSYSILPLLIGVAA